MNFLQGCLGVRSLLLRLSVHNRPVLGLVGILRCLPKLFLQELRDLD